MKVQLWELSSDLIPKTAAMTRRTPKSMNRYSYVLNNSLKYVDPLGLVWVRICSAYTVMDHGDPSQKSACNYYWVEPQVGDDSNPGWTGTTPNIPTGGGGNAKATNKTPTPQKEKTPSWCDHWINVGNDGMAAGAVVAGVGLLLDGTVVGTVAGVPTSAAGALFAASSGVVYGIGRLGQGLTALTGYGGCH